VVRALLDDVLCPSSTVLVIGPHGLDIVEFVAAKCAQITVLVRSVSDAAMLTEQMTGGNVHVIAGALDGLGAGAGTFDAVVAADGLDRVLGTDSAELSWRQRLSKSATPVKPDGVLVVGLENEFSLMGLFDSRPTKDRHGDDEWRPLRDDPDRPVSATQLRDELARIGFESPQAYAAFPFHGAAHVLLDVDVLDSTRPGRLPARLAVQAMQRSAGDVPLLAPIADAVDAATRAGLLGAVAPRWLAVWGAHGRALYAQVPRSDVVITADVEDGGTGPWRVRVLGESAGPRSEAAVIASSVVIPAVVPDSESVHTMLLRLAAAEDVPGFRALAARLGEWARAHHAVAGVQPVIHWDDTCIDGQGFTRGVAPWVTTSPEAARDLLAAAWHRFHHDLVRGHHRHPWPPWMVGNDLVATWLSMSGEEASIAALERGRQIADALSAATGDTSGDADGIDLQTALADAAAAQTEAFELAGHIAGLERTLAYRDKQLRVREQRIRRLRKEVRNVEADPAVKLAHRLRKFAAIRHPRRAARRAVRRILRGMKRLRH
jgi:hypothetical protein